MKIPNISKCIINGNFIYRVCCVLVWFNLNFGGCYFDNFGIGLWEFQ